ncbi:putative ABC transport system ATP-binding protein [Actinobaculum suis]|uniref:ABC transporter n=1 Tax=Actinobaculum suis TaxID=1657 RepID=A0A1G7DK95_9ACTO|nr:ATP-binding cassette domain-containing protein [Actinobaculum suis]MDY5154056.1 ATP-binding cassette domain-containing protein [Actinobaculum suis]SDE51516.1 putative ABC transport system ATP-binding protein [Actinobaculum suis]VDG77019.1 ABC transporter [Actinobaculum suis]
MRVEIDNLQFEYGGVGEARKIFDNASTCFRTGRFYALMGPSGSGKTTLFRLLTREVEPVGGQIRIGGRDLSTISVRELRSSIVGQIFQDYVLVPFLSPLENLLLAREITDGRAVKSDHDRAKWLLARVGLEGYSTRAVELLSGGEQQRVAIARALMGKAGVLLADEPTGALDRDNTVQIAQLLAGLAHDEEMIVIAGTHDGEFASYADGVVRIRNYDLVAE